MKIFIVRKDDKIAVSTQEEAAKIWGYDDIFYVDRDQHSLGCVEVRPTDIVGIYRLDLLAAQGKKASKRARESLLEYMTTVFRREGTIVELSTGRTCENKADLLEMYHEACNRFLRGYKSGQVSGRPKKRIYTDGQALQIDTVWNDRRHRNNSQRVEAVQKFVPGFNQAAWYDKDLQKQIANLKEDRT